MGKRIGSIRFTTDRRGRPLPHRWSMLAARWFPIGYEKARLLIATGAAEESRKPNATVSPQAEGTAP